MNEQVNEATAVRQALRVSMLPFLLSRLLILLILILTTHTTVSLSGSGDSRLMHPRIVLSDFKSTAEKLRRVYMVADAKWYQKVAERGYTKRPFSKNKQENWAFFPLFPLAAKALSTLSGNYLVAALIISNFSFFLALALLYRLAQLYGYGNAVGQRALWFVSFFPSSYFLTAPITEGLFFFLSVFAFYLLKRRFYLSVGIVFALLTASRPTGLLLVPALVVAFIETGNRITFRKLTSVLMAPIGVVLFSWHLYTLTGNPLAWADIHAAWERSALSSGELPQIGALKPELLMEDWNFRLLHLLSLLLGVATTFVLLRRKAFALATFVAVPLAVALSTGSLLSMSRFVLVLYPVFLLLGQFASTPARERSVLALFVAGLAIMTLLFGLGVTAAMA